MTGRALLVLWLLPAAVLAVTVTLDFAVRALLYGDPTANRLLRRTRRRRQLRRANTYHHQFDGDPTHAQPILCTDDGCPEPVRLTWQQRAPLRCQTHSEAAAWDRAAQHALAHGHHTLHQLAGELRDTALARAAAARHDTLDDRWRTIQDLSRPAARTARGAAADQSPGAGAAS